LEKHFRLFEKIANGRLAISGQGHCGWSEVGPDDWRLTANRLPPSRYTVTADGPRWDDMVAATAQRTSRRKKSGLGSAGDRTGRLRAVECGGNEGDIGLE
jgi:hypothetical protein